LGDQIVNEPFHFGWIHRSAQSLKPVLTAPRDFARDERS
jgi:hypothetical protein